MAFKINTAVTGLSIRLISATDGSDMTSGTPVGYYTLDDGSQTAIADTPVHKGNGEWNFDLTAAEMNGDTIGITVTLAGAITAGYAIKTVSKLTSELNDFNSSSDVVNEVTTTVNNTDMRGTDGANTTVPDNVGIAANGVAIGNLNDFNSGSDVVAHVTLVDTVTENTDKNDISLLALEATLVAHDTNIDNKVSNISTGSAALSVKATGFTKTVGGTETNNYESTNILDGVTHQIEPSGNDTDGYYTFNVGSNGVPVEFIWDGYANSNGDSYTVYAWNYLKGTPGWDQIGTITGTAGSTVIPLPFGTTIEHVGVGANIGEVKFRFLSADGTKIATDRVWCSYTVVAQSVGYALGGIWVDLVNGEEGSAVHKNGTADNPCKLWSDALLLNDDLKLNRFLVASGNVLTLPSTIDGFNIMAEGATINLNGQSASGARILGAHVTGSDDGTNIVATSYLSCIMATSTLGLHMCDFCKFTGHITMAESGEYIYDHCSSFVASNGTPEQTFGASNISLNIRHWSGGFKIWSMALGDLMSFEGDGQFKIGANCTGGSVSIRGSIGPITDDASGAVTLTENARISDDTINAQVDIGISDANLATAAGLAALNDFDYTSEEVSANVTKINNNSDSAVKLAGSADGIFLDLVATTGDNTSCTLTNTPTANDVLIDGMIIVTSGLLEGERKKITDYTSGRVITFDAMSGILAQGDTVVIV